MRRTMLFVILSVLVCLVATSTIVYAQEPFDGEGFPWPVDEPDVSLLEPPAEEPFAAESSTDWIPVDLHQWSEESYTTAAGFPPADWVNISPSGEHVWQYYNGQPTVFYSDFNALWTELQVGIGTGALDDDYFGLAVGFEPGDSSNEGANYILIDWKQATQYFDNGEPSCTPGHTADRGLAVSRVFGVPTTDEFWGHANDDYPCSDSNNGVEELARGSTLYDTGWPDNALDTFRVLYTPTRLKVYINGHLEIDIEGTFSQGRWAFYNDSQPITRYSYPQVRYLAVPVTIDIKPGSDPNCVNSDSHGVIPVAILTTDTFDATTVDPLTVMLAGAEVRVKGKSGNAGSLEDVNGDGYDDLVVQVYTKDLELVPGDAIAELTGETYGGIPIYGSDSVSIVPPK